MNYSLEMFTLNLDFFKRASFFASSLSNSIISFISSSKVVLGIHPNSSLALLDSPNKKSTSVGLKYRGSILLLFLMYLLSFQLH